MTTADADQGHAGPRASPAAAGRATVEALVLDARQVTPAMRRITLGGAGLASFVLPTGALGPYLKLHLRAENGRALVRTYSVRRHDRRRGELEVDMLLHGDGPGARFASAARPGERVPLSGPGFIPAAPCEAYLLAGDHTALPAIAHILAGLPEDARAQVFVEVPGRDEEQALPTSASAEIRWLHRGEDRPSRLAEAVRSGWPTWRGDWLVWAGAEAAVARAIRTEARVARGIPPARCQVLNYWKAGQPEGRFSYCD